MAEPNSTDHPSPAQPAPNAGRYRPGPHGIALLATVVTWPLLFVGGLVTTYRVGMAVPDWPTTFGINMFLYNFWTAPWGVYIEHTHRLLGSVAGLGCVVLAVWFTGAAGRLAWRPASVALIVALASLGAWIGLSNVDPILAVIVVLGVVGPALALWYAVIERQGLPALGWLALTAVVIQGALGGYRVRMNSTDLAAVHGGTGQAFFALMISLCVVTGRRWLEAGPKQPDRFGLRWWTAALTLLVYGQILAGALLRHRSLGLEIHSGLAVAVLLAVAGLAGLVLRWKREWPTLVPAARAAIVLVLVQVALGVASWWVLRPFDGVARPVTRGQAIVRTAHQANGALLLAASTVLALRAARQFGPSPTPVPTRGASPTSPPTAPASRDLEAAIQ